MTGPVPERWQEAVHAFPAECLDRFLLWAADRGASDIAFQTGSPAFVEIDGSLAQATDARLDGPVMGRLCERLHDATAEGILRSGRAIDCSHAVRRGRGEQQRFRCNLAPVQGEAGFAVNITLRVLPGRPPGFDELGIEDEIVRAWDLCKGLVLVTGVPGSGKSTLLAAGTRRLLERGAGRIQSYEAPIEYVFDGIAAEGALMSSAEIPRHFPSFADGLRSSLRRRPTAVVVGEARDRETVEAVVRAADYGIAVFSTTHTIGVAATVRRMLAEFPADERAERGAALIDAMTMVVTQVLLPNPAGGRTALREWLVFDAVLKAALLECPQASWPARIGAALAATGNDLAAAADRALHQQRIGEDSHRRILVGSEGSDP
ncbi:MAG: ATPase, T2SS/T4P/T4SS family [Rhodospirillales bacterium]|nr:ATPase, T2SS/T4P/T4SS family [Rhodospirillales bacterium]MDE0378492.1 ATPase, T2SS/T4P/T4SS family [Rhodospirillales bacterium]